MRIVRANLKAMRDRRQILEEATTIAVVGASRHPHKSAHTVPLQMLRHGWRIVPVNPHADEVFGERAYPSLTEIPIGVDLVNVFRPSRDATQVVREAIAIGAPAVWLQSGIVSAEGRGLALAAGVDYVEDHCIAVERALAGLAHAG